MVYRMLGMIIILLFISFGAILATDSLWWGLGITVFICLAIVSMISALIVLVPFLIFLSLSEHHLQ